MTCEPMGSIVIWFRHSKKGLLQPQARISARITAQLQSAYTEIQTQRQRQRQRRRQSQRQDPSPSQRKTHTGHQGSASSCASHNNWRKKIICSIAQPQLQRRCWPCLETLVGAIDSSQVRHRDCQLDLLASLSIAAAPLVAPRDTAPGAHTLLLF